jgi:hypothetical protein
MLSFQEYILEDTEYSHIENHPKEKMRSYTEQEFPWEYREYTQYAHGQFPRAFENLEHFTRKYNDAPLVHLKPHEIKHLGYATASEYLSKAPVSEKVQDAHYEFSHRRDLDRIHNQLYNGQMAPPIVLKHSKGLRILGGNTRLSYGLANNKNIPVKVIDISDKH